MAGFKLFVFDREAHFIGPQESGCSTIGRSQKAVWILAHHQDYGLLLFPRIGLTVVGSSAQKGALASNVKSSPDWPARERESQ